MMRVQGFGFGFGGEDVGEANGETHYADSSNS